MATYADGRKEYRLSDKVGNLYNDPDKKLRKYLEGGRIEKSGEWTFKYDKDGQLIEKFRGNAGFFSTKKDRWEYSWTQNGMLEGVLSPHRYGQWTRFTYDALGRRLTKLGDATFHYLWNGNVPLHEWRTGERYEDGGLKPYSEDLKTWLFEEESFVPLALIQEGKAYSIVCDQLGTPMEAYDEEGKEVWYRRLDMNGKVLEETQPGLNPEGYVSIPFLFQGQYYDHETGLAYNRFRYYDPELGRYISEDPIRFASGTLALHSYVSDTNDWVDTLGLEGTYAFIVDRANKVAYVGKGKWGRFRKSLRHKMRAYYGVIKAPNGWASKFLGNDSLGEMLEAKVMEKLKDKGYTLLNEISSPGVHKLQDSGTAISRILDDVANDMIAEMEQNVTAPVKKGPSHV